MASQTELKVLISANLTDIKQSLGLLRGELAKVKSQSAQAFSAGNGNAFVGSLRRMRTELVGLVGAYASLAGGKMLAGIADEATQIRGRIREAKGDYQAILELAQRSRTGIQATTDLYTRLERSTRGQITNQAELLAITESVNQAIKLSYQGTAQGEAAVLQLGQALASGKLAGDELRSLSENAPRLIQAIADGMGVARGQLKELAKDGKLTSDVVIKALQSQAAVLQQEYARVPLTIGDAFTQIRNSFVDFIGNADAATGASRAFAEALQGVARNLPALLTPLLQVLQALIQHFDVLIVFIGSRMALAAIPALIAGVARLQAAFIALRTATLSWSVVMAGLGGPIGIALAAIATALYVVYQRTNDAKVAAEQHRNALADNAAMARTSAAAALQDAQAKRVQAAATLQAARAALEERRAKAATANARANLVVGEGRFNQTGQAAAAAGMEARRAQRDVAAAEKVYKDWGDRLAGLAVEMQMPINAPAVKAAATIELAGDKASKAGKKAKEAKEAVKGVIDVSALALDQIQRDLAALEQLFEDGKIKAADYFAERSALQAAALDKQIEQAKEEARTATSTEQQSRALTDIVKLQRDRLDIGPRAAREQAKAEEEASKKTLETLRAKQAAIQEELRGGTDYLAAQEQLGSLGPLEAEQQLQALRQRSIEQLRALRQAMIDYLAATAAGSPEHAAAVAGLQQLDTEIAQVQASQQTFRNQIKDNFYTSLLSGFDTVRRVYEETGSALKAAKAGLLDFARSFVTALNRMAAEALAKNIMGALFKGGSSTGGGGGGGLMSIFTSWLGRFFGGGSANGNIFGASGLQKFAKGAAFGLSGISAFANGAAFTNSIVSSPTLFAFGKGGQFGVMGEAGDEAVMPLTRGPGGRLGVEAHGTGGAGRVTTPIVVLGDRAVADALAGTAGRDVVITHVLGNIDKIRGAL